MHSTAFNENLTLLRLIPSVFWLTHFCGQKNEIPYSYSSPPTRFVGYMVFVTSVCSPEYTNTHHFPNQP